MDDDDDSANKQCDISVITYSLVLRSFI